jgi:hypothetical protein
MFATEISIKSRGILSKGKKIGPLGSDPRIVRGTKIFSVNFGLPRRFELDPGD